MNKILKKIVIDDRTDNKRTVIEVFRNGELKGESEIQIEEFKSFRIVRVEEFNLETAVLIIKD